MKHWWHSGSHEITVRRLQERLAALPGNWMIRPTEFGFHARDPQESPDVPLILDAKDLSTVRSWALAAKREHHLNDDEEILLSKVEAMKAVQEI